MDKALHRGLTIGTVLAAGALTAAADVPQAMAQATGDLTRRSDAYQRVNSDLDALEREARLARGGPRNACARFEELVRSLSDLLGPQSALHRETLIELRRRFGAIVNLGCPRGTPRTFLINTETGAIRDSGPQPPAPRPLPAPEIDEQARIAPGPVAQPGLTRWDEDFVAEQQKRIDSVETKMTDAEAARLRGDCRAFRYVLESADGTLDAINPQYVPPDLYQRLQNRISALFAAPCPPSGIAQQPQDQVRADPPPPPNPDIDDLDTIVDDPDASLGPQGLAPGETGPTAASPPAEPRTEPSTLFFLEGNLSAAVRDCDREAFDATRERLLALIDSLIAEETDPERRIRRQARRAQIASRMFPEPCEPERPQTPDRESELDAEERRRRLTETSAERQRREETRAHDRLISIFFSGGRREVPQTGIGFRRDGASGETPETSAGATVEQVWERRIGGLWQSRAGIRVGIDYAWGDTRRTFEASPVPGGSAGFVYSAESPGGSTGIAAPFPVSGETRVAVEEIGAYVEIPLARFRPGAVRLNPFAFAEVRHRSADYYGNLTGGGSFGGEGAFIFTYEQERDQQVHDTSLGFGFGVRIEARVGGPLSFFTEGRMSAYWRNSNLDSIERNGNNFTGPPDDAFTVTIDGDDDGVGFHGALSAGFDLALSANVKLRLGAWTDYRSHVGGVFNPNSGDQLRLEGLTTALRSESIWSWGGFTGIIVALGQ